MERERKVPLSNILSRGLWAIQLWDGARDGLPTSPKARENLRELEKIKYLASFLCDSFTPCIEGYAFIFVKTFGRLRKTFSPFLLTLFSC